MEESTSREKIFKKIRSALLQKTDAPYPNIDFESDVYRELNEDLDVTFAEELLKVSGEFVYCESEAEFVDSLNTLMINRNWYSVYCAENKLNSLLLNSNIQTISTKENLTDIQVGLTSCDYLIARLGSVLVSTYHQSGRHNFVYPPVHLVFAYSSQIVPDLKNAFLGIKEKYQNKIPSFISLITGPSRTADIEKTLIMGAHGPKELIVFLIDDLTETKQ